MSELARPDRPAVGRLLVDARWTGESVVLTVYGEVDLDSVAELDRELVAAHMASPKRVIVDLDGVSFMDSSGLRALIVARQRADIDGYELVLERVPDPTRRLLALAGVSRLFALEE